MKEILLSHGGGGDESNKLIHGLFFKHFGNEILERAEDASFVGDMKKVVMSTDSFVVSPIFFKGGNIGKLAVAGTVNDVCMMGATPRYLSASFIIEEGLAFSELEEIVITMKEELAKCGVKIVTGDTKVVPRGGCDKIFINTTGVGEVVQEGISAKNLQEEDAIIVSGPIGDHGACILAKREGMDLETDLKSDCAVLHNSVQALLNAEVDIHAMRDATRGGLSAVLNEWAVSSEVCIEVNEEDVLVRQEVEGICEILGFEPYEFANEGTYVIAVPKSQAQKALKALHAVSESKDAVVIGTVSTKHKEKVLLHNAWGSARFLEPPKGELLPRIC